MPKSPQPKAPLPGALPSAKPARRRSEVTPATLAALEAGTLATRNLVEWLALDLHRLFENVLIDLKLDTHDAVIEEAEPLRELGIMQRVTRLGSLLHQHLSDHPELPGIMEKLSRHPSDTVRIWAISLTQGSPRLTLRQRLAAIRPFADDEHFGVRECAWMAVRPALVADMPQAVTRLTPWARDPAANIRRFAIEAIRPCGVWCAHAPILKTTPELALPVLEALRGDKARYVQLSVANWLNDSSKSQPKFVTRLCQRWLKESPTTETKWIAHHALRTMRKREVGS
jgi:3-methyladenine DNA glycosylase AlkC